MAVYSEEEELWKCPKHPSKRRRNGICPACLRDRLFALCPDCANVRPCACCAVTSSSSSASSSSSFSFFSSGGRVSDLIDSEQEFRRSRSVGIPFLFSRFAGEKGSDQRRDSPKHYKSKTPWFWSWFWSNKSKKSEEDEQSERNYVNNFDYDGEHLCRNSNIIEDFARMKMRSRSVHVVGMKTSGDIKLPTAKGKGWSFPSPMKVFRHSSKTSKVVQDRSPLCSG